MATFPHKRGLDGSPVFDATGDMKITVNPNDIQKADRKEAADCAMARAIRRCTKCAEVRAHVGRVYVRQRENGPWKRYETTAPLRNEIIAFDRGGAFEPGEYLLRAIRPAHKPDARKNYQEGKNRRAGSKGGRKQTKRMAPHSLKNVRGGPVI